MQTNSASCFNFGSVEDMEDLELLFILNATSPMVRSLVFPRCGTVEYSQLRMAKKKAAQTRSAMHELKEAESMVCFEDMQEERQRNFKCFPVIAFSLFLGGSSLDQAWMSDPMRGWILPIGVWQGLCRELSPNFDAR